MSKQIKAEAVNYWKFIDKLSDKHVIPDLQRPYSWEATKQVKRFLDDVVEREKKYFIGSIVFIGASGSTKRDEIIDGQQRLTTLSLLLISIRKIFKESDISDKVKAQRYIDEISELLQYRTLQGDIKNRLKFSEKLSNKCYGQLLREEQFLDETDIQKSFNKNFKYIENYIKEQFIEDDVLNEKNIFLFIEKIKELQVVSMACSDGSMAYELFESMNSTGLSLASVDLIKNFIFKELNADDDIKKDWAIIENIFQENRGIFKKFIRHQWISSGHYVSESDLYESIRKKYLGNQQELRTYQKELVKDSDIYFSLRNALGDSLPKISNGVRNERNEMIKVLEFLNFLNVEQVYSVLLHFYKRSDKATFGKQLNKLVAFQFLYKYVPGSPSSAEKIFANMCSESNQKNLQQYFNDLYNLIRNQKEAFKEKFLEKTLYRSGKTGDLQFVLEQYVFSKGGPVAFDKPTIEHIISQSVEEIHTIGNLTIFEKPINGALPELFVDKKEDYKNSPFKEHHSILKYDFEKDYHKTIEDRGDDVSNAIYDVFMKIFETGKLK